MGKRLNGRTIQGSNSGDPNENKNRYGSTTTTQMFENKKHLTRKNELVDLQISCREN